MANPLFCLCALWRCLMVVWLSFTMSLWAQDAAESVQLTFLETSDLHGQLFPYDFITDRPLGRSLAHAATLIEDARRENPGGVVLLDGGDGLQGQPVVYHANFIDTASPHVWAQALNCLGYDAVAVGNHDIEAGHGVFDRVCRELACPMLCANAVKADGAPYFAPYAVLRRKGLRIAVLGLVEPKISEQVPPGQWRGLGFRDMVETARHWVPHILEKEKPDLMVGLFHAGVDDSRTRGPMNENASQRVLEQVPGLDMAFVGHDHRAWRGQGWDSVAGREVPISGPEGRQVFVFGPDAANGLVKVHVTLRRLDKNAPWSKSISGTVLPLAAVRPSEVFTRRFQGTIDAVKAWVDQPLGVLEGTLRSGEALFGPCAFMGLIHQVQMDLASTPGSGLKKADISFAAPLSLNSVLSGDAHGIFRVRDAFNLYKYENFLYTVDLTGLQVRRYLEHSYGMWVETLPNPGNHLIALQKDSRGNPVMDPGNGLARTAFMHYNFDSAQGIRYTVDVTRQPGKRVKIQAMADGAAFDEQKTYSVAINSYRACGAGGHLKAAGLDPEMIAAQRHITSATDKDLRLLLMEWFKRQKKAVKAIFLKNWSFSPEKRVNPLRRKDERLLFGVS